jgi:hypothetical protein
MAHMALNGTYSPAVENLPRRPAVPRGEVERGIRRLQTTTTRPRTRHFSHGAESYPIGVPRMAGHLLDVITRNG